MVKCGLEIEGAGNEMRDTCDRGRFWDLVFC